MSVSLPDCENQISDLFPRKLQQQVLLRDSLCFHILHATTSQRYSRWAVPSNRETLEATQLCSHIPRLQGTTHVYISERNFQEPFSGSGLNCGTWKKNQQAKVRFQKSRHNHVSNLELGCTTHRSHRQDEKKVNRGRRVYS